MTQRPEKAKRRARLCAVCETALPASKARVHYCQSCGHPNPAEGWEVEQLTPRGTPRLASRSLSVRALIDGASELWFRTERLLWVHVTGHPPGLPATENAPTWINACKWLPEWSRTTRAAEARKQAVAFELPSKGDSVTIDLIAGRGRVLARFEPPCFVLRFEDPQPGACWYELRVRW